VIDPSETRAAEWGRPERAEREPGWSWNDLFLALAVTILGAALVVLAGRGLIATLGVRAEERLIDPAVYVVGAGVYLAAILGVYLFGARKAGWGALGLRGARWPYLAVVPLLLCVQLFLLVLVNSAVSALAGGFENPQVDALTGGRVLSTGELVALLILVAGLVPFAEELLFRGMLYPLLRRRMGAVLAVVLNAACFAAAHVVPLLLPGLFVVGLILAALRERSGSIWPGVFLHALQNGTALLLINEALRQGLV
jgi:hypothetical protein